MTKEDHEESLRRLDVYKGWFLDTVMQVGIKTSFVVMQSEDVMPKYRDDPPPSVYNDLVVGLESLNTLQWLLHTARMASVVAIPDPW